MNIIDTCPELLTAYQGGAFSFAKWSAYMDAALPGLAPLILSDVEHCLKAGNVSWEADYLPVLNAVLAQNGLREEAHASFRAVTRELDRAVQDRFGKSLDVDLVFYLGLCNGAGWVTEYRGRKAVLLGIEKIMELSWCGPDEMRGLIYHELGHIYQGQYGVLDRTFERDEDAFLWQLFTEGIAMYFEQALVGDFDYYHQDRDGWKEWCDRHFQQIKTDFAGDLKSMTFAGQRYFGDWVSYHGHSDVGYYLGCRFVHSIRSMYEFDELIGFPIDTVARLFQQFIE